MSDAPCPACTRILHTGEGRVLVALTVRELTDLVWDAHNGWRESPVIETLLKAIGLLDADKERETREQLEQCRV